MYQENEVGEQANSDKIRTNNNILQPNSIQRQASSPIQMYAPVIYAIHPDRNRVVPWNFIQDSQGIYSDATYGYQYNIDDHQFVDDQNRLVANPLGDIFDEDANQNDSGGLIDQHFGMNYETDNFNRITRAHGTINLHGDETGRSGEAQIGAWRHMWLIHRSMFYGSTQFNGGHIIAHHFGGSPGTHNMVPMEKAYNQSPGSQSYKDFENSLDTIIGNHGALQIDVHVGYPADSVDGALSDLWSHDNGGQIDSIKADPKAAETIKRLFRTIPNVIALHSLTSGGLASIDRSGAATAPRNPRLAMVNGIRSSWKIQNIYNTSFDVRSKDDSDHWSTKTFKPYRKIYGAKKGEDVDQEKDYEHDYMTLYKNMPKPGITNYLPTVNGLAGGVEAYIWMDPMGIFNKFGGTDTNDEVDPLGTDWRYFRKAEEPAHGGNGYSAKSKIYKRGHLLNALLHGPGTDSRNLLPLTSRANTDMSTHFEEPVKRMGQLVNPRKGVFWKVQAQGQIARPLGWALVDAQGADSGQLWQQESNMPSRLVCEAWEGTIYKGEPKKGRLLLSYIVQNKLNNTDPDGVLNITHAGALANDHAVDPSVPSGDSNVRTTAVIAHNINNQAYDNGYQLTDQNYPNPNDHSNYLRGIKDRAFDDGFGRQPMPVNTTAEYRDYYDRGLRRVNALEGEFNINSQKNRSQMEWREYDRGQRKFGENEARNQRALPVNSSWAAQEGHEKGSFKLGYDHGFNNSADPQSADENYLKGYDNGQYEIGFEDAFERQTESPRHGGEYMEGFKDGVYKRGRFDGEDNLDKRANGINEYDAGYRSGQNKAGFEEGRNNDLTDARRLVNKDFEEGYNEGQYERGRSHGDRLRNPDDHVDADHPYNQGYRKGLEWAGEEDGRALRRAPDDAPDRYMDAYNYFANKIGYNDGYHNLRPQAMNIRAYYYGYRDGGQDHERDTRDYNRGYDAGRSGDRFFKVYNEKSNQGFLNGSEDKRNFDNGYRDGYELINAPYFASQFYRQGHNDGVYRRGYDDGYSTNNISWAWPNNHNYMRAFDNGRYELGRSDGYNNRFKFYPNYDAYNNGYRDGRR